MRGLTPTRRDDGAVAVVVAVFMVVMLGFGALVLDVGALYSERRQLQNGADAAALAVVRDCPVSGCDTGTGPTSLAGRYANVNANDAKATVHEVCGVGGGLTPCSPVSDGSHLDCGPVPPALAAADYVQVRTRTLTTETTDPGLIRPFLAQVLSPGSTGLPVGACARASWGGPSAIASGLAMTISYCEWDMATAGGADYAPAPPAVPAKKYERVVKVHAGSGGAAPCPAGGHSGFDGPGAFGWLDDGSVADCSTDVSTSGTYEDKSGNPPPDKCKDVLQAAYTASPPPVFRIPVYRTFSGGTYTFEGMVGFVVTGWENLTGGLGSKESWLYPENPSHCTSPTLGKCLYGYFTQDPGVSSGTVGGPYMGVLVTQLSG